MSEYYIILSAVLGVVCLALIFCILKQKKRTAGLGSSGAMMGQASQGQTYWEKNKARSPEGRLERFSVIFGTLFFVISLALSAIK